MSEIETTESKKHPRTKNPLKGFRVTKKSLGIAFALVVVGCIIMGAFHIISAKDSSKAPNFPTLLPANTTIERLGGWQQFNPPDSAPAYSYKDTINKTSIIVSQQQLPEDFKVNTNKQVEELAKSYNATTKFEVSGTTVFSGRSSKGPESLIFTKNNLLVFIMSEKTIEQAEWTRYINSLIDSTEKHGPTF